MRQIESGETVPVGAGLGAAPVSGFLAAFQQHAHLTEDIRSSGEPPLDLEWVAQPNGAGRHPHSRARVEKREQEIACGDDHSQPDQNEGNHEEMLQRLIRTLLGQLRASFGFRP